MSHLHPNRILSQSQSKKAIGRYRQPTPAGAPPRSSNNPVFVGQGHINSHQRSKSAHSRTASTPTPCSEISLYHGQQQQPQQLQVPHYHPQLPPPQPVLHIQPHLSRSSFRSKSPTVLGGGREQRSRSDKFFGGKKEPLVQKQQQSSQVVVKPQPHPPEQGDQDSDRPDESHVCQLHSETLSNCLDTRGTYLCMSYSPRCYIIQKVNFTYQIKLFHQTFEPPGEVQQVSGVILRRLLNCTEFSRIADCGFPTLTPRVAIKMSNLISRLPLDSSLC